MDDSRRWDSRHFTLGCPSHFYFNRRLPVSAGRREERVKTWVGSWSCLTRWLWVGPTLNTIYRGQSRLVMREWVMVESTGKRVTPKGMRTETGEGRSASLSASGRHRNGRSTGLLRPTHPDKGPRTSCPVPHKGSQSKG